jgi:hypothetical protein
MPSHLACLKPAFKWTTAGWAKKKWEMVSYNTHFRDRTEWSLNRGGDSLNTGGHKGSTCFEVATGGTVQVLPEKEQKHAGGDRFPGMDFSRPFFFCKILVPH